MKKSLATLLNTFVLVNCLSCCTTNIEDYLKNNSLNQELIFSEIQKNVVSIHVYSVLKLQKEEYSNFIDESGSGTAFIIENDNVNHFSIIVTAAHVCDIWTEEKIIEKEPKYNKEEYNLIKKSYFTIHTYENINFMALPVIHHEQNDLCLLVSPIIPGTVDNLNLITNDLKPTQKLFSIGFPEGLHDTHYSPLFEGYFSGLFKLKEATVNSYTIPATPGSSGSPVFDSKGNLAGTIHTVASDFEHISMGSNITQIKEILQKGKEIINNKKNIIKPRLEIIQNMIETVGQYE